MDLHPMQHSRVDLDHIIQCDLGSIQTSICGHPGPQNGRALRYQMPRGQHVPVLFRISIDCFVRTSDLDLPAADRSLVRTIHRIAA